MGKLDGKKAAILVTDGFEQVEMTKLRESLEEAGIRVVRSLNLSRRESRATHPDEFTKHFLSRRQTSGRNLSRALGVDRRRCCSWTQVNVVGAHSDRREKCRWQLGQRGSGGGQRTHYQPQAR